MHKYTNKNTVKNEGVQKMGVICNRVIGSFLYC